MTTFFWVGGGSSDPIAGCYMCLIPDMSCHPPNSNTKQDFWKLKTKLCLTVRLKITEVCITERLHGCTWTIWTSKMRGPMQVSFLILRSSFHIGTVHSSAGVLGVLWRIQWGFLETRSTIHPPKFASKLTHSLVCLHLTISGRSKGQSLEFLVWAHKPRNCMLLRIQDFGDVLNSNLDIRILPLPKGTICHKVQDLKTRNSLLGDWNVACDGINNKNKSDTFLPTLRSSPSQEIKQCLDAFCSARFWFRCPQILTGPLLCLCKMIFSRVLTPRAKTVSETKGRVEAEMIFAPNTLPPKISSNKAIRLNRKNHPTSFCHGCGSKVLSRLKWFFLHLHPKWRKHTFYQNLQTNQHTWAENIPHPCPQPSLLLSAAANAEWLWWDFLCREEESMQFISELWFRMRSNDDPI